MDENQNLELAPSALPAPRPVTDVSTSDRWRAILVQQVESGLSVSEFCRQQGLTASSLFAWRRRLGEGRALERKANPIKFVEMNRASTLEAKPSMLEAKPSMLEAKRCAPPIEVCLRGIGGQALDDRRLLVRAGFDRDLLIELIRTLEGMP